MDIEALIEKAGGVGKLAGKLGVSHSAICDWKRAGAIPAGRAIQISRTLNVPVEKILELTKQSPSETEAA